MNPALFGTKERRRDYGAQEGGSRSGARVERKKKRRAGRAAATRAEETLARLTRAEAEGKKLTKAQHEAMARAEKRLQAEGAMPDDARLRELAKQHQAQERALEAVLGKGRKVYAVKIALEGRPFRRVDLEALQQAGWTLRPAGTVPATVGRTLAALNPSDAIARILGTRGEARAVVIQAAAPFGEDLIRALQADGYDLSAAPKAMREEPARAINPGHKGTEGDTRGKASTDSDGSMATTSSKTSKTKGRVRAPKRVHASAGTSTRAGSKPSKASRSTLAKKKVTKKAAPKKSAPKNARTNPTEPDALKRIWKAWTGSDADKVIRLEVSEARRLQIPAKLVLLGLVSWLASAKGEDKRFGNDGPLMVTDAGAKKVWLVSEKPHRFDLEPALIGYQAKKPKFGDKNTVEYVHAFEHRAHAVMDGQVGALTGSFRITPAGLEG